MAALTSRLRRLLEDLSGRGDEVFVTALVGQIDAITEGTLVILEALDQDHSVLRRKLADVEESGNEHRAQLIDELARALTTPLDREDLFRVSRSIDDVLDNLRDFGRELDLFSPASTDAFGSLLHILDDGIAVFRAAVLDMRARPAQVTARCKKAKEHGNSLRRHYQQALAALFADELTMETLKQRDLLRRLDVVGLRFGEAADALADAALKRSH